MIRGLFLGFLIIIVAISAYNIGNNFVEPLKNEADSGPAPNWVIDTVFWAWNHWIYLMLGSAILIIFLATQQRQTQEWTY